MMKPITTFVKNNAFVVFVVLAYLLAWWPALLHAGLLPHGPLLAALIVVGLRTGLWSLLALALLFMVGLQLGRKLTAQEAVAPVKQSLAAQ